MYHISYFQYFPNTFTSPSKITLPNIRKGLVKLIFPLHLLYLNGSLSKRFKSLEVYFSHSDTYITYEVLFEPLTHVVNVLLVICMRTTYDATFEITMMACNRNFNMLNILLMIFENLGGFSYDFIDFFL